MSAEIFCWYKKSGPSMARSNVIKKLDWKNLFLSPLQNILIKNLIKVFVYCSKVSCKLLDIANAILFNIISPVL